MSTESVRVVIRFRPENERERREANEHKLQSNSINIDSIKNVIEIPSDLNKHSNIKRMAFDCVFDTKSSQEDVFMGVAEKTCRDIIRGYNGTIFAYGQTGSGLCIYIF